jgi:hypothetical protein
MSNIYSRDVCFKVPFRSKNIVLQNLSSNEKCNVWETWSFKHTKFNLFFWWLSLLNGPERNEDYLFRWCLFHCSAPFHSISMYSIVWDPNLIETHLKVEFYYSDVSVFIIRSAPFHYNYLEDEDHDKLLFYDHIESQRNGAEWKNRSISVKGSWKT